MDLLNRLCGEAEEGGRMPSVDRAGDQPLLQRGQLPDERLWHRPDLADVGLWVQGERGP